MCFQPCKYPNYDEMLSSVAGFGIKAGYGSRKDAVRRLSRGVDPEFLCAYAWRTAKLLREPTQRRAPVLHLLFRELGTASATREEAMTFYSAFSFGRLAKRSSAALVKKFGKKRAWAILGCSKDSLGRVVCSAVCDSRHPVTGACH